MPVSEKAETRAQPMLPSLSQMHTRVPVHLPGQPSPLAPLCGAPAPLSHPDNSSVCAPSFRRGSWLRLQVRGVRTAGAKTAPLQDQGPEPGLKLQCRGEARLTRTPPDPSAHFSFSRTDSKSSLGHRLCPDVLLTSPPPAEMQGRPRLCSACDSHSSLSRDTPTPSPCPGKGHRALPGVSGRLGRAAEALS